MKYLYNHNNEETSYLVEDYPWGFRLRTKIRYWIESKDGFGQRFCSQTINPKTGIWCKPKKSTYADIAILFLDDKNHIHVEKLAGYNRDLESLEKFKKKHLDFLDDFQRNQLQALFATEKVMQKVSFTITRSEPVSLFSRNPEDIEKRKAIILQQDKKLKEEKKSLCLINRAIGYEMANTDFLA